MTQHTSKCGRFLIKVINGGYRGQGIYIGRPSRDGRIKGSPLGNPYTIGLHGTRDEVCDKYLGDFLRPRYEEGDPVKVEVLRLVELLRRDGTITLRCFCAPQRCHGDSIAYAILSIIEKEIG